MALSVIGRHITSGQFSSASTASQAVKAIAVNIATRALDTSKAVKACPHSAFHTFSRDAQPLASARRPRHRHRHRPSLLATSASPPGRRYLSTESTGIWTPPTPEDVAKRPVLIIGAGNLGRRMATIWASTGRPVILHDISDAALISAVEYIGDELTVWCAEAGTHPGHVTTVSGDLAAAITSSSDLRPWMAVEAVPEDLALKRQILAEVERLVPEDCLLASNSSSYRTAEMTGPGGVQSAHRLLSTYYYYMSPYHRFVELMSSGSTDAKAFPFLEQQMTDVSLRPIVLPPHVQYNGFVFNRIWEAIREETLRVVREGHVKPADIDELFKDFFRAEVGPCGKMGLDLTEKKEE